MKILYTILFFFLTVSVSISQEWEQVASLPGSFQTNHSFAFSIDGKGYIVSGMKPGGVMSNEFFEYDPSTDTWTQLPNFPGAARGFAIGDVYDGKAYFGFGSNSSAFLRDLWVFDPADQSWTRLADCLCEFRNHPSFVTLNNKIYVGLGSNGINGNLNDWWEYDIATDTWALKAGFPAAPRHHPYMFGIGDYVYTGFGHGNNFISNEWYRYDPATNTWDQMATLPAEGRVAGTQFSHGDLGYVLSGDGEDHSSMEDGEFWSYDPSTDTWEQLPSHPGKSRWAPASFIIDNEVYIINGQSQLPEGFLFIPEIYKYPLPEVTSTEDNDLIQNELTIFPNPVEDFLNLEIDAQLDLDKTRYEIYNAAGQMLLNGDNLRSSINVKSLNSGTYFLNIWNNDNLLTKRFVKK